LFWVQFAAAALICKGATTHLHALTRQWNRPLVTVMLAGMYVRFRDKWTFLGNDRNWPDEAGRPGWPNWRYRPVVADDAQEERTFKAAH